MARQEQEQQEEQVRPTRQQEILKFLVGDSASNFTNSLKSEVTRRCYIDALIRFMKFCKIKDTDTLAQLSPAEIEFYLKRYLEH